MAESFVASLQHNERNYERFISESVEFYENRNRQRCNFTEFLNSDPYNACDLYDAFKFGGFRSKIAI